ncbi:MAG: Asp-tRNA(Asn)/Glu-tRNA(Gln) amidotransferase subunit GatC [Saprospiraceae bacterium]|nr:Asp-tRNA(Asn)/Glu-tRNA(Gln) amidotransferase subunit GatC [Saprospiraceae bacterium]
MHIDDALISRLEKLARLRLDATERRKLTGDLQRILDMVDTLRALDTDTVEPLIYLNAETTRLREDEIAHQLPQSECLQNAPKHDGAYFRVPKMIDSHD